MQRDLQITVVLLVVIFAVSARGAFAQQPQSKCLDVKYSDRVTDAYTYRLKAVAGLAVYGEVSEKGELTSASGVCVALFNLKDKSLADAVATESGGQFRFANVGPGKYVLIVSLPQLHEIIIPLEVTDSARAKGFKRWELLLHLRSRKDRRKSFVTPITQTALRDELIKMAREDQAIRNEMIAKGADLQDQALEARRAAIDIRSTARIKAIAKIHGWPGPELVGRDGADAAFLLLQHSPDLALQRAMLPLIRRSYEKGKLSAWNYALFLDRVLVRQGRPQVYGMSVDHWANKEPVLSPLVDEANVDKRRATIGLPPLREYLESMKRQYFPGPEK